MGRAGGRRRGYLGFQLFALGAAVLAGREAKAREELALANAELLATREANASATRTAERLRIARDLHDSMGHRLTALRLQLEVAKNSTGDQQTQAIAASSDLSKLLLGEVREVVSAMREEAPMDLEQALSAPRRERPPTEGLARDRSRPPKRGPGADAGDLPLRPGGDHERGAPRGRGDGRRGDRQGR